jgi:hypothetical protein
MTAEPERRFDATGLKLLEAVAPLRDLLSELVAEAQHIRDAAGDLPAAESPAMAEIANEDAYVGAWAQQPLKLAQSIAGMCLAASEDQLATLFVVLSKCDEAATFRAPAFGHMSIARSVVESCARAGWLLEPIISYEDRATRAIGELLYSNWERAARLRIRTISSSYGRTCGLSARRADTRPLSASAHSLLVALGVSAEAYLIAVGAQWSHMGWGSDAWDHLASDIESRLRTLTLDMQQG